MTGFDRRGPFGRGPMTGRGRGYCGIAPTPVTKITDTENLFASQEVEQPAERQTSVLGLGRGGIPFGCGRGFCRGGPGKARNRKDNMR